MEVYRISRNSNSKVGIHIGVFHSIDKFPALKHIDIYVVSLLFKVAVEYRNEVVSFNSPEGSEGKGVENLETHIFSADRIADLGDLSPFEVGYCNIGAAVKL